MALGPEAGDAARKNAAKQKELLPGRIHALKFVEITAKYAEIALDAKIPVVVHEPRIYASDLAKIDPRYQAGQMSLKDLTKTYCSIILYAKEELLAILREKYLTKGWKSVYVHTDYHDELTQIWLE